MGWNGSDGSCNVNDSKKTVNKGVHSNGKLKCAVVGLAIVVALCVIFYFANKTSNSIEIGQEKTIEPKKTLIKETPPVEPISIKTVEEPQPASAEHNNPKVVKRWGHSSNVPSSDTNRIHYATMDGIKIVGADGETYSLRSTPLFKDRIDNMVWAAIRPGGRTSGLYALRSRLLHQTGSDEAFIKELTSCNISIEEGDSPQIVDAKMQTADMKAQILKALDEGHSFEDVCRELSSFVWQERMTERIAQKELTELMRYGDPVAIRDYVNSANKVLREKGLKELRIPSFAATDDQTE